MYTYVITNDENGTTVSCTLGGKSYVFTEETPELNAIISALIAGEEDEVMERVISPRSNLGSYLEPLTERISFDADNSKLLFDGDVVDGVLEEAIVKRYKQGYADVEPLLHFYDNLMQNPSQESREQLFIFLSKHRLIITEDGTFLAYKGLSESLQSIHAGYGIVNGEVSESAHLDNSPGNVISIPRSKVDDDREVGCSHGLHAGSYEYARGFGSRLVVVEINPRDVVSVPSDSNDAKLRVCRYQVLQEVDAELDGDFYAEGLEKEEPEYPLDTAYSPFVQELKDATSRYSTKGKVGNSYTQIAEALGYGVQDPEYFFAEMLDTKHTANAVYRYHIEALE